MKGENPEQPWPELDSVHSKERAVSCLQGRDEHKEGNRDVDVGKKEEEEDEEYEEEDEKGDEEEDEEVFSSR